MKKCTGIFLALSLFLYFAATGAAFAAVTEYGRDVNLSLFSVKDGAVYK
jgi:hypothetical protein